VEGIRILKMTFEASNGQCPPPILLRKEYQGIREVSIQIDFNKISVWTRCGQND
jgi:hypothetical protein